VEDLKKPTLRFTGEWPNVMNIKWHDKYVFRPIVTCKTVE
jgi:hypothetical protein